ncbi:hypothetical protein MDA_GLEAN10006572 [Myotis davidii]|uniref:Uncharacterized protein n=1 Tax=Myotis davidii TaxID=225400 RepID=L5M464_MYODS|nr:hypothetical protein MDA_GLEAN10006572 [Myotis davidii]
MEMIIVEAEEAMIKVATEAKVGTMGASDGAGRDRGGFGPGKMDSRGDHRQDRRERPY